MKFLVRLGLTVAVLLPMAAQASLTARISYFKLDSSDPDANHLCCSAPLPEVRNNLGPDGLPLLLTSYGGITPHDVNGAGGCLT